LPPTPLRVLGVDTSLRSTGVGIIETKGNKILPVYYGTIKNPQARIHSACLGHIYRTMMDLVAEHKPTMVAVEGVFFCKNVRTAVTLGQARGVVLAVCSNNNLAVYEYSPRRIKKAIVGTGTAAKGQISSMVASILGLEKPPQSDAADALAIAICHAHARTSYTALAPDPI